MDCGELYDVTGAPLVADAGDTIATLHEHPLDAMHRAARTPEAMQEHDVARFRWSVGHALNVR